MAIFSRVSNLHADRATEEASPEKRMRTLAMQLQTDSSARLSAARGSVRAIRKIGEMAGCTLRCDEGLILYGDNRITGVFSTEALTGSVKLPYGNWREEFSGKVFEDTDEIDLEQFNSNIAVFIRK